MGPHLPALTPIVIGFSAILAHSCLVSFPIAGTKTLRRGGGSCHRIGNAPQMSRTSDACASSQVWLCGAGTSGGMRR